jgi:Zn-dependent M28 family amino/carboxypeptidase
MDPSKVLFNEFKINDLIEYVYKLSKFHRIQGTDELERAGDYIFNLLKDVQEGKVTLHKYDYYKRYGAFDPVVGWSVTNGELRIIKPKEEFLHSFDESKTFVVAHSPGGKASGSVVYIKDGENPSSYNEKVGGKIILTYGDPYIIYKNALEFGALGVILYKYEAIEKGVPYMGLFLSPDEAKSAKIPIVSISRSNANKIINWINKGIDVKVSISVQSSYREYAQIPVITYEVGTGDSEIHLYAHYCHPANTINDNVSGAASLLVAALAIDDSIKKGHIEVPDKHKIRIIWFPEYAGSLAYLSQEKPQVLFSINLDMIGEKQELTGSTINFIRPPPQLFHPYEAILYHIIRKNISCNTPYSSGKKVLCYKFDSAPYSAGSDHDIYIHYKVPSVMINQWPDKFYHSDLDTIEKFDAVLAKQIAVSALTAAYISSVSKYEDYIGRLSRAYFHIYIGQETLDTPTKQKNERYQYLVHMIGRRLLEYTSQMEIKEMIEATPYITIPDDGEYYRYIGEPGVFRLRYIYNKLGWHRYRVLKTLIDEMKFMNTIIRSIIPLYLEEPHTLEWLRRKLYLDFGVDVDYNKLKKIISILQECNLIIKTGKLKK